MSVTVERRPTPRVGSSGRLDLELDEVGLRQATAVAELVLSETTVDAVISSPLNRATQTADRFGMPYEVDERWIELSYGEWEGKTHLAVPSGAWARWKEDPGYVPEGGESLLTLDERVRAASRRSPSKPRDNRTSSS